MKIPPRPIQNHGDFARLCADISALPSELGAMTLALTSTFEKDAQFTPAMVEAMRAELRESFERALEFIDYELMTRLFEVKAGIQPDDYPDPRTFGTFVLDEGAPDAEEGR